MSKNKPVTIENKYGRQWREERLTILTEVIQTNPTIYWSARKLADYARTNTVIGQIQPNYGTMTAWRDWAIIQEELRERREEIANEYIDLQLEQIDFVLDDLQKEYKALENIVLDDIEESGKRISMQLRIAGAKKRLVEAMDKLWNRQQTLLPIAVPKTIRVDTTQMTMTMDQLIAARKEALKLEAPKNGHRKEEVIDGELIAAFSERSPFQAG